MKGREGNGGGRGEGEREEGKEKEGMEEGGEQGEGGIQKNTTHTLKVMNSLDP